MSAYGSFASSTLSRPPIPSTVWPIAPRALPDKLDSSSTLPAPALPSYITVHHLTLPAARSYPGLLDVLHKAFADEIDRGLTYPQETLQGETVARDAFEGYFFAADVIVGIVGAGQLEAEVGDPSSRVGQEINFGIEDARSGRSWDECVAGFYYIKPNYPGRSSHICNSGFIVPPAQRGSGYGSVLARTYLHYAPRLGYEASVFNLVYVNNVASVRIWERLGFMKAGRIPRAGRLKRADGQEGEEYVDAWVFYKSFTDE